ncbi:uncharacterized protein LOC144860005 [Branchiostoma floridae x Branchiostoma japonicum]
MKCDDDFINKIEMECGGDNYLCTSTALKQWRDTVDCSYDDKIDLFCHACDNHGYHDIATDCRSNSRYESYGLALCDDTLRVICDKIDDWKQVCTHLGCDDEFIHKFQDQYKDDVYQSCFHALKTWRDTFDDISYDDKVNKLCQTLRTCGHDDCADTVLHKYDTENCFALCDHQINIYSHKLADDWVHFCKSLNCDDDFISKIDQECGGDNYMCISTALKHWRNTMDCSYADKVDLFCHACDACGFDDVAEDCKTNFRHESYGLSLCDDTLRLISSKISDWKLVCTTLGCDSSFIHKFQDQYHDDTYLSCFHALKTWRDTFDASYDDKVNILCQTLRNCGYTDCAGIVDDKHRTECSVVLCDSQIDIYSKKLSSDWKNFCTHLGCDDDFISKIDEQCNHDNYLCISTALKHWRDTVDSTYVEKIDLFCHACDSCGFHDIAVDCRDNFRHEVYVTSSVSTGYQTSSVVSTQSVSASASTVTGYQTSSIVSTQFVSGSASTVTGLALCDDTFHLICDKISDDWRTVCIALGCGSDMITKVVSECGSDDVLCCSTMLKHWRDSWHEDYSDKVDTLCTALRTCGYTDCATTVYSKYRTEHSVALCDGQIDIYSKTLSDDWKTFCHALDCSDDFITKIEVECGHDDYLCCETAIKTWRDTVDCSYADKIDHFCNACHSCGFDDIAVDCRDHYRNEVFVTGGSSGFSTGGTSGHYVSGGVLVTGLALCDDTLRVICHKIDDWKQVCTHLGCDDEFIHKFQDQYKDNVYQSCFHALKTWRDTFDTSYDDKYNTLCKTLRDCGYYDCADTLYHKYRTEHSFALCDSQIDVYSHKLSDDWKNFCYDLKCDDDFINKIEVECGGDNYLCISTALKHWRDTVDCSYDDKIDLFCHACESRGFYDIAVDCRTNYHEDTFGLALFDDTLRVICHKIDDWKLLCTHLGCDDAFINKIQQQHKDDTFMCCFYSIQSWRDTVDFNYYDKVITLCDSLRTCGYDDCAKIVYDKYRTEHDFALCDSQIDVYSHKISDDWKYFCVVLGCDSDFISKIEKDCDGNNYLCINTALKHWRNTADHSYAEKIDLFCYACDTRGFFDIGIDCRANFRDYATGLALCDDTLRLICSKIGDWKLVCTTLGCDNAFINKFQKQYHDASSVACFHALRSWRDTFDVNYDDKVNILCHTLRNCGYTDCAGIVDDKHRTECSVVFSDSQIDVYSKKLSSDWKNFCTYLGCDDDFIKKINLECSEDNYLCISTALKHWRDTVDCSYVEKIDFFCHACESCGYHDVAVDCRDNFRHEIHATASVSTGYQTSSVVSTQSVSGSASTVTGLALCDDTFHIICTKISDDWRSVCIALGCGSDMITKVVNECGSDDVLCCSTMLKNWRDSWHVDYSDKVYTLCTALRTCGYTDCATTVYSKYRTEHSVALCDGQIDIYSKTLSHDWKTFCHALDCSDDFITKIEVECGHDDYLCCGTAIKTWRDTVDCSYADKIDHFCNACYSCGFDDIAVDCRDHYRNEVFVTGGSSGFSTGGTSGHYVSGGVLVTGLALCDDTLRVICHKIDDWKLVCTHLGCDDAFVHKFQDQYKDDSYLSCFHALKTWRDTFDTSYDDKYNTLWKTLRDCHYYDCADTVYHKYRTEHSFALCDSQIDVYSHKLSDDWKYICDDLKCDDDFINKIEVECGGDNYLCISTALKHWRDTVDCSYDDKIDLFCHACDNRGHHDIATDCRSNFRYESYGLALCDDTLRVICHKIDDWKQVCTHLGCDDEFIHKFQDQYKDDVYQSCFHALKTWRDTFDSSYDDKVNKLCLTLRTCGHNDCADTVVYKYDTENCFALCDHQINIYSHKLADDWVHFCKSLNCDDDFISKIDHECGGDNYMCISTALKHWRNTMDCSYADKVDLFTHACYACGFDDVAVDCKTNYRHESYGLGLCDDTLRLICSKISDWKLVCTTLGCDYAFIHKFQDQYHDDAYLSCFHALKTWRDTFDASYDDKVNILCQTLRNCGYTDCAGIVDDKHRTECSVVLCDSQIDIYSKKLSSDWKNFCTYLGCDDDFISKIDQLCGHDNYLCISTALKHWRDTVDCSYVEKIDLFCHACDSCGFHDIAVDCRDNFRHEVYVTSSVSTGYQTSSVVSTQSVSGSASTVTGLALCDDTFHIICTKISDDWRSVCIALGCGSDMITKVVSECGSDDVLCCSTMLKNWRDTWHVDYSDKVDTLCTALRTCGYTDCATTVYSKYRTEHSVALCDGQIDIYSKTLSHDWKTFCHALDCSDDFITKIEVECGHDDYLCCGTAIKTWRDTVDCSYADKIDHFCNACYSCGFDDIAVDCRDHYRNEVFGEHLYPSNLVYLFLL